MSSQLAAVHLIQGAIGERHDTAFGYTNPYGAQCLAFDAWYLEQLGYTEPIMPGYNAIDVYIKNPLNLKKVTNPQPGDLFFQNATFNGVNLGHTGVVSKVVKGGIYAVAQNARNPSLAVGSPASEDFYDASTVAGYLRPNFSTAKLASIKGVTIMDAVTNEQLDNFNKARDKERDELWAALNASNEDRDRLWVALNQTNNNLDRLVNQVSVDKQLIADSFNAVDTTNKRVDKLESK